MQVWILIEDSVDSAAQVHGVFLKRQNARDAAQSIMDRTGARNVIDFPDRFTCDLRGGSWLTIEEHQIQS
jgi:hypothetical protein